jgi:hypothetical protein
MKSLANQLHMCQTSPGNYHWSLRVLSKILTKTRTQFNIPHFLFHIPTRHFQTGMHRYHPTSTWVLGVRYKLVYCTALQYYNWNTKNLSDWLITTRRLHWMNAVPGTFFEDDVDALPYIYLCYLEFTPTFLLLFVAVVVRVRSLSSS